MFKKNLQNSLIWQFIPVKPGAQEHEYVEDRLMQTPLFTQGFEEQKLLTGTGNSNVCYVHAFN